MKRTADDQQQQQARRESSSKGEDAPRRRLRRSDSSSSRASDSSGSSPARKTKHKIELPPRTVEILWDGRAAPGFTLKRKRSGAIQVSTVAAAVAAATKLRVGSELRLVGGFPVARLTLKAVKKVMLCAPKPVSLVFVNADELDVLHNDSTISGASEEEVDADARLRKHSTVSVASSSASDASMASMVSTSASSRSMSVASASESSSSHHHQHHQHRQRRQRQRERESESTYGERSADNTSKKRKVSRLQVALDRVNQLLNRPVRQSGLNIPPNQSIVV